MALFGSKKKKEVGISTASVGEKAPQKEKESVEKTPEVKSSKKEKRTTQPLPSEFFRVLKKPRITEKATWISEKDNAHTFEVAKNATKNQIKKTVEELYGVVPTKVHIVPIKEKKVFARGKRGVKAGGKKAYVFLKHGDTIEFV